MITVQNLSSVAFGSQTCSKRCDVKFTPGNCYRGSIGANERRKVDVP